MKLELITNAIVMNYAMNYALSFVSDHSNNRKLMPSKKKYPRI